MSKYRRIRYEDRCQIYALSKRGASQESIASVLGVSQSAVSREMCRNRGQRGYRFKQAEAKAQARQAIRSKPRKLTAQCARSKIEAKLRQMRRRRAKAAAKTGCWTIEIVERSPTAVGFEVLPKPWIVERTFAWLSRFRRLARDFER